MDKKCYLGIDFKKNRYFFGKMPDSGQPTLSPLFKDEDVSEDIPLEFRNELLRQIHRIISEARNKKITPEQSEFVLHDGDYAWLPFNYIEKVILPIIDDDLNHTNPIKKNNAYCFKIDRYSNCLPRYSILYLFNPKKITNESDERWFYKIKYIEDYEVPFDFIKEVESKVIDKIYDKISGDGLNLITNGCKYYVRFIYVREIETPLITEKDISLDGAEFFNKLN
jgi:hypothetical protein